MPKKYNVEPAESDFGKLKCMDIIKSSGSPLLAAFVSENPYGYLMKGVTEGKYAGLEKIGGKECHHLSFKGTEIELFQKFCTIRGIYTFAYSIDIRIGQNIKEFEIFVGGIVTLNVIPIVIRPHERKLHAGVVSRV